VFSALNVRLIWPLKKVDSVCSLAVLIFPRATISLP